MNDFEYAKPETEAEAVELLSAHAGRTAVLAGGTDLLSLLRKSLVAPERVVDLKGIAALREIRPDNGGVVIGANVTLADLATHPLVADYTALHDMIRGIPAIQVQSTGTLVGDLCLHPNCWYYRGGYGLTAWQDGRSLVADGDNRYHAILGNQGPAKFVNASRLAPAGIAWQAKVRIVGPGNDGPTAEWIPLESLYVTPRTNAQGHLSLRPGQFVSHVWLPDPGRYRSATYEVLQTTGLDWPLAAAAVRLDFDGDIVRAARIVLGHVAPIPWLADAAARGLIGSPLNEATASRAGDRAVAAATPLSKNEAKVQQTRVAVKRALLQAAAQSSSVTLAGA